MSSTSVPPTTSATSRPLCAGSSVTQISSCRLLYIGVPLIVLAATSLISLCIFWGTRRRKAIIQKRNKSCGRQRAETFILTDKPSEASEAELEKMRAWERWWTGQGMSPVDTRTKDTNFRRLSYESYASMTLQGSCCGQSLRTSATVLPPSSYSVKTSFEDVETDDLAELTIYPGRVGCLSKEISTGNGEYEINDLQKPAKLAFRPYLRIPSWPPGGDVPEIRLEVVVDEFRGV